MIASGCAQDGRHHQNLTVLDLGFNSVGDAGCTALSLHMVAGNHTLRNLFLSGNHIERKGAMALASAILHGCSLSRLNLSANNLGADGINADGTMSTCILNIPSLPFLRPLWPPSLP